MPRDFPGDPGTKTVLPMQGARVRSLVRELRSYMPQLKSPHSQINKLINKNRLKKIRHMYRKACMGRSHLLTSQPLAAWSGWPEVPPTPGRGLTEEIKSYTNPF